MSALPLVEGDLLRIAARYTTLRRESADEFSGPCPRCGGKDRLHVWADRWFCRRCYPFGNGSPHDAAAFLRWVNPSTSTLDPRPSTVLKRNDERGHASAPLDPRPSTLDAHPRQRSQSPDWIARAEPLLARCREALRDPASPGFDYAVGRGFTEETLEAFHVGYHRERNALALPWYRGGRLHAIRYRAIDPAPGHPKMRFEPGSRVAGLLWGRQALRENGATLLLVEGEFNAMSIHQVAERARVDVLSLGSESATLTPAALAFAQRYAICVVWMDRREVARERARQVGCHALWSGDPKRDANDHLQTLTLRPLLAALLARVGALPRDLRELGA